jgi:methylmalonyl-CoA mutase N-terminal domain/subunit
MDREEMHRRFQKWESEVLSPYLDRVETRDHVRFLLDAGPEVQPVYTPLDAEKASGRYFQDLGLPGEYPFTRGISPDGPRSSPPLIKFYSGLGTPEDTNRRYKTLLSWGVEMIQIASDLPSQVGYDADHIMATGEVGRAGVSISSLRDMEIIFDGIPLTSMRRVGMLFNSLGPVALALFIALGEKQGLRVEDYVVELQNDPLKEYVARGTQILPVRPAVKLAGDVVEWCAEHAPHWSAIDVCVNHLNSAGAGSTNATAFALANAVAYIDDVLARGLHIDSVAPLLQMFLDEREDFFVAVANVRATRRIWARMMKERFAAKDARSAALRITAYGHGRETRQEPLNNIVRIAYGSLAYYLAGIQALYDSSYDEVLSTPSEEAVKIAVRTQQILNHEGGFSLTADPLGGSYYVEALTDELDRRIAESFNLVESKGGAIACIENGYIRNLITEGAVKRQERFEAGSRIMVGVNRFASESAPSQPPVTRVDPNLEERQRRQLAQMRKERESAQVVAALSGLEQSARRGGNLVPAVLEAVRAYATVGEICDVFRAEYGEWHPDQQF